MRMTKLYAILPCKTGCVSGLEPAQTTSCERFLESRYWGASRYAGPRLGALLVKLACARACERVANGKKARRPHGGEENSRNARVRLGEILESDLGKSTS
eukprot:6213196-Pleurochrysis_carterae.AAC.6